MTRESRESSAVRRSPRLSGRFSNYRDDGGTTHRSTYTPPSIVSSRPSLRGYGTTKKKVTETSILNESGQSVPTSFCDEGGSRGNTRLPEHLFGEQYTLTHYVIYCVYIIHKCLGLDESDNESSVSVEHTSEPSQREYERIDTTRVYTPIRESYRESKGQSLVYN